MTSSEGYGVNTGADGASTEAGVTGGVAAGSHGAPHRGEASPDRVWTVEEHLADILGALTPLPPRTLPLLEAQGCVLAEDVRVPAALPPFDNSSMDGYAVRVADVAAAGSRSPAVLRVVGDVAAGSGALPAVGPGEAARVMTGAPLPPGAEAVVPVEWTDGGTGGGPVTAMVPHREAPGGASGEVRVYRPAEAGAHVRAAGSDAVAGSVALTAGTVLGPAQLGLLAAVGCPRVRVRPRPRVAVLSTGSELVPPGEPLGPGRIHDSNGFVLTAAARRAGAHAERLPTVGDDAARLRALLAELVARVDVVVTSGGVSVGAYDVVKEALAGDGPVGAGPRGEARFRRLAMQPGKPQGFGLLTPGAGPRPGSGADGGPGRDVDEAGPQGAERPAGVPLLALPGNPVSAYVSFELFVRPVIRALMGHHQVRLPRTRARLVADAPLRSPRGKRQFLRARHRPGEAGPGEVVPVGGASSHLLAALARANALLVVPEETESLPPGAEVEVVPLEDPWRGWLDDAPADAPADLSSGAPGGPVG